MSVNKAETDSVQHHDTNIERERIELLRRFEGRECIYKDGRFLCRARIVRTDSYLRTMRAELELVDFPGFFPPAPTWDIGGMWDHLSIAADTWRLACSGLTWRLLFNEEIVKEVTEAARRLSEEEVPSDRLYKLTQHLRRCEVNKMV
jgi:hypothetical protein